MKILKKISPFLFIVLVLGAILRFYNINQVPPSLNWDEVSHGYNAFSILTTGRDEWGKLFPTIFRAYGDYKLPVYIYLTAISEFFFGLSTISVRIVSILAGIGTILFTYLLTEKLFGKKVALFSSLFVAIEPWSLFVSRAAFEANLALFFIVSGAYYSLVALKKPKFMPLSAILLGLSVWTYNSARIFVPLLILSIIVIYFKELKTLFKKHRRTSLITFFILILFFAPMFYQLIRPAGQARYGKVEILDQGAIASIEQSRATSNLSPFLNRALNNRVTYFSREFLTNFYSHFSPQFLFFNGGTNYQFSVPSFGLLYYIQIPFFILGLVFLAFRKEKDRFLIVLWMIFAPVPSSLTREAPHVLRALVLLPAPMILTALGVTSFVDWLKGKKKLGKIFIPELFLVLYLFALGDFLFAYYANYMNNYKETYSWSWQYGYKEVVNFVNNNYSNYDKIIVTKKYGEPHEFFLFYGAALGAPWDWQSAKYQSDANLIRFYQSGWYWVDTFDKFYFVNDWDIPNKNDNFKLESGGEFNCQTDKCLLVTSPDNHPPGWTKLKTVNFLDGSVAFEIYENK